MSLTPSHDVILRGGGLDLHPLISFKFLSRGQPVPVGGRRARRYAKTLQYIQSHIVYLPLGP